MFDQLKAERSGARPKERMRLWITVAACLVLGTAIYGGKSGCAGEPQRSTPVAVEEAARGKAAPAPQELDRTPLLALAERTGSLDEFDPVALDYVVSSVRGGKHARAPWKVLRPADVATVDPAEAVGRTIETRGTVRLLDREERDLPGTPQGTGRLWAFSLEDEGGSVVVVHPGSRRGCVSPAAAPGRN
jgi:hypothetical protein